LFNRSQKPRKTTHPFHLNPQQLPAALAHNRSYQSGGREGGAVRREEVAKAENKLKVILKTNSDSSSVHKKRY
jgi:hypothetical protein